MLHRFFFFEGELSISSYVLHFTAKQKEAPKKKPEESDDEDESDDDDDDDEEDEEENTKPVKKGAVQGKHSDLQILSELSVLDLQSSS